MGGKAGTGSASPRKQKSSFEIWHNPRCSKSRQTLKVLRRNKVAVSVREYLVDPPSAAELERVIALLGIEPRELMRKKEEQYKSLGLDWLDTPDKTLVNAMANHPQLIERPVVIAKGHAVIGRPPERVRVLLPGPPKKN